LAGDWETTTEEATTAVVTFDDEGVVVRISGAAADGEAVSVEVTDATTTLEDGAVTVRVPTPQGEAIFEGTLSADQNTLEGSLSPEVTLGDTAVIIPEGDITLMRIVADPCEGVTCDEGEVCVDGECVVDDPCADVVCDEGQSCVNGECVEDDPCAEVTCSEGETCVDGECLADVAGDPAAGEAFYAANCASCHGADGTGGFAPPVVGVTAAQLTAGLESSIHDSVSVIEEDLANLEAFLAG
jgi:hypothetical protein